MSIKKNSRLQKAIDELNNSTDGWPWYWIAFGEKEYAFATVAMHPAKEGDPFPKPGSTLYRSPKNATIWIGENGTEMVIAEWIAMVERQNGDCICEFIALAHAELTQALDKKGDLRSY